MDTQFNRPASSFRGNQSFWLRFAMIVLVGLLLVGLTFMTAGSTQAAYVLWAELAVGLACGIR